jgi:acetoin utilization deacetylase AcuC-like enzyme
MGDVIPVFYTPRQSAAANRSFSPSAEKPTRVVAAWEETGLPLEIVEPRAATVTDLCRAHDQSYVLGVLGGHLANGFGNTLAQVRATLPWTVGSLLSAAERAAATGEGAFSPTSGFHHAGWAHGGAFCTFNGLVVAAQALRIRNPETRVAILDCDQHFGNGTREIIQRLALDWVRHYSYGAAPVVRGTVHTWLEALPGTVERTAGGCDVVLYQAGADPHVDDPLGGAFTTEQLAERDRIVFGTCLELGVPVVTTLAGGYQKPVERVVDLHVRTLREYAAIHGHGKPLSP